MSWSVGYTPEGEEDVVMADSVTFRKGMSILWNYVRNELIRVQDSDIRDALLIAEADIMDIRNDSGIMGDPDQQDDEEFFGLDETFWIVQN